MKRSTLLNISLLITGIVLGGFIMWFFNNVEKENVTTESTKTTKLVKTAKTDTVIVKKKVYIPSEKETDTLTASQSKIDSTDLSNASDSIEIIEDPIYSIDSDTNFTDDDVVIIKERLIASALIEVNLQESDSLTVEEAFDLQQVNFAEHLVVEFWESPLELTGYELTRNKIKLFGFDPSENVILSHSVDTDILEVQIGSLSLRLQKTSRFKTLYL